MVGLDTKSWFYQLALVNGDSLIIRVLGYLFIMMKFNFGDAATLGVYVLHEERTHVFGSEVIQPAIRVRIQTAKHETQIIAWRRTLCSWSCIAKVNANAN